MREHALAGTLVQRLATHKRRQFADEKPGRAILSASACRFGSDADPVRVAPRGRCGGR